MRILLQDIDQQTKVSCCCGKVQSSKDLATDPQYREERETLNTSLPKEFDRKDEFARSKNDSSFDVIPIRRFNSSDSVTICEIGSSRSVRKFSSYEHLRISDRFINNYNQAKVTELNDEEDEVVNEINEPVFVDIPTLVAVLIKPDSLQESTQIEEICSDEVQEDSIDADFIEGGNEEFEGAEKLDDVDPDDSVNSCNALGDSEISELHRTPPSPASVGRSGPRGKFNKQNSIDLPSSNLNVSKKFGSIDGISKKKEFSILDHLQRSHTNLEKRPTLPDRGKKLNNIREIDDRKVNAKSGNIWKAIGNVDSKDHLQRKNSNESDKSSKDSNISKTGGYNIGRKPSLENLKRKTSKDSSSSSSKDEQILISSLTRDKLLRRKNSLDHEVATTAGGVRHHTAIQRIKRADIVAAVTERLYSSRKHTEESSNNMATSNTSGIRSPPENLDVKVSPSSLMARSRLQEISRKMLMKRRRINVDTQTEEASTLRLKDMACLTDEPKVVLQDAAVLTEEHADYDAPAVATTNRRLPVLRVKDMATLTDRRPRTSIFRCKDAESLTNDLDFDDYELHSSRNDSGILSDDTQNYAESNLSSAEISELYPEADRRIPCTDSSTNTFLASSGRNSAVQTESGNREVASRQKESSENRNHNHCCGLIHQLVSTNSPEKNVISISLPDMISITIESTNGLESRIAVTDGSDAVEENPRPISSDKESQTEQIKNETEGSFLKDLTVKSTAIQADGRVFRIENIFQDPRSNSCRDATSDLTKETATKKSMVFRSSLGTSSVIEETKENNTKTEWDIEDPCQRKRPILKGDLTRAFVAKRRSCSLSPRRPSHNLACHDLWKNWTLPCSEFIDYSREVMIVPPIAQQSSISLVDDLLSSTAIDECTSVNKVSEESTYECNQDFENSFEDLKKTTLIKDILDCDYNFSDDSLDFEEDNVAEKSIVANAMDTQTCKNYESVCPPDVVAHTKKEALQANHVDSIKVESSIDDFDDAEMEFPKRKPVEILDKNPIQDYKALILGKSSYFMDSDSEEEANVKGVNQSNNIDKKKVSFSNPNSPEEITDVVADRRDLKRNSVAVKSIIKKMKKPAVTENLDIVQSNVEVDRSSQQGKKSTTSEQVSSASKEDKDLADSRESLNDEKIEFSDEEYREKLRNESDSEDTRTMSKKKNILEEYLNEAMIFMRNLNSINEYMSAVNTLESYGKHQKRRGGSRGKKPSTDRDHIEFRGRKVSLKDDTNDYLRQDKGVAVESYVKCLKGIERLEACIDKADKHNQILRDRYGIDVESAGAKSSLASLSVDSEMSSFKDGVIRQCDNVISKNDIESCNKSSPSRIPLPFSSSIQTDVTKQSMLKGTERRDRIKINDNDSEDKDDDIIPEDDLERKIFDQLMRDFSEYRSPTQLRQKRLWKIRDLRSRSPTTYSKLRETFRRDARGILNFDQVSAAEDYLDDIRGIESSPRNFRKTKLCDQMGNISLKRTSIDSEIDLEEFYDNNELPEENGNPFKIAPVIFETKSKYPDCSIDPAKSIEIGQTSNAEEEIARKITQRSKDSLRLVSPNPRFVGSLSMELKYPGSPRAKFLELLKERRRIVENSRGTNAF